MNDRQVRLKLHLDFKSYLKLRNCSADSVKHKVVVQNVTQQCGALFETTRKPSVQDNFVLLLDGLPGHNQDLFHITVNVFSLSANAHIPLIQLGLKSCEKLLLSRTAESSVPETSKSFQQ